METSEGKDTFLIDGFPRNQDNLEGWKKAMDEISVVKMVLFFNCTEEVSLYNSSIGNLSDLHLIVIDHVKFMSYTCSNLLSLKF